MTGFLKYRVSNSTPIRERKFLEEHRADLDQPGARPLTPQDQGASYDPKQGEPSARAKTARTGQELLKVEPAL